MLGGFGKSKASRQAKDMKREPVRGEAKSANAEEQRRRLIEERPSSLGLTWAQDSCADVTQNGRRVEGGWPGTVPEARMRVLRGLTAELASRGLEPLSQTELAAATATVYDRARREWQLAGKARVGKASVAPGVRAAK